jgi:hypothetical protein
LLDGLEALHGRHQVLDLRGGDEADVGRLAAEESGGINEEAAAAAKLEVGVKDRLAGFRQRLHHLVPAVHLVNHVAINIPCGFVLFEELLGLLLTGGQGRDKLETLALPRERLVDAGHSRPEIKALVGPVRPSLRLAVQSIDDADARLVLGFSRVEPGRGGQHAERASRGGACPGQEVSSVHRTAGTAGEEEVWFHIRLRLVSTG